MRLLTVPSELLFAIITSNKFGFKVCFLSDSIHNDRLSQSLYVGIITEILIFSIRFSQVMSTKNNFRGSGNTYWMLTIKLIHA